MASININHWSLGHHETFFNSLGHYDSWLSYHNSANGWELYLSFSVNTVKSINYIIFTVTPIDAVGGIARSEIAGESTTNIKMVGPITSGKEYVTFWKNLWYIPGQITPRFGSAILYYSDGTTEIVSVSVLDNRNHVDYFSHYENEQRRGVYARAVGDSYTPKAYKEKEPMSPGLVIAITVIIAIIYVMCLDWH